MRFASDNWAGVHPKILEAIIAANDGTMASYGSDEITAQAIARINEVFECDAEIFFVTTGGGANGLALSVLTPPYGMILCHEESHIEMDECAGPEFFTGGAKLTTIPGFGGKLTVASVKKTLSGFPERPPHGSPARVLSLTNLTECGTAYSVDEIRLLTDFARAHGLCVHMDGARFANALIATGTTPAELSWKSGVDVLCLGGTKNGCLAAEAVIFFDKKLAADFAFRRKRAGHLLSKQRFMSAQFEAWLHDDLWLSMARHANAMARQLSDRLQEVAGVTISYPTQGNEVFVTIPDGAVEHLKQQGAQFYPWITPGDPAHGKMQRLICSFATTQTQIDQFLNVLRSA